MGDVKERVVTVIVDHLGVESEKVTDTAVLVDDLGADSLDIVELVMSFEDEFAVEITDADANGCKTVGDFVKLIETLTAA